MVLVKSKSFQKGTKRSSIQTETASSLTQRNIETSAKEESSVDISKDITVQGNLTVKYVKQETSEIFSAKYSPDDEFIGVCLGDGRIVVNI
jgi:hypothetical protein